MFWLIIAIIGGGSFVFSGISVLSDPYCQSVDFGGGRVIQMTCRNDSFGAFSQVSAGWLSILAGLGILLFIFRKPLINIFRIQNSNTNLDFYDASLDSAYRTSSQDEILKSQEMTTSLDSPMNSQETKKCPYCAEFIQTEAIKCKHCGSSLTPNSSEKIKTYLRSEQGKVVSVISICILLILSGLYVNQSSRANEMKMLNANGQICVVSDSDPSIDFGCTKYPNGEIYFCAKAEILEPFWASKDSDELFLGANYNGRIRGIRPGEIGHNCPNASLPNLFSYKWVSNFRVGIYELMSMEYRSLEGGSYISGGNRTGDFTVEISIKE